MKNIQSTELFRVMRDSQEFGSDDDIVTAIRELREQVKRGEDPTDALHEMGIEPDYILDLM